MNFIALHNRIRLGQAQKIALKEFEDIKAVLLRLRTEAATNANGHGEAAKKALCDVFIVLGDYMAETETWTPTEIF